MYEIKKIRKKKQKKTKKFSGQPYVSEFEKNIELSIGEVNRHFYLKIKWKKTKKRYYDPDSLRVKKSQHYARNCKQFTLFWPNDILLTRRWKSLIRWESGYIRPPDQQFDLFFSFFYFLFIFIFQFQSKKFSSRNNVRIINPSSSPDASTRLRLYFYFSKALKIIGPNYFTTKLFIALF